MSRTLASSLAGAAVGFLLGYIGVVVVSGARPDATDTGAITLFLGSFLAAAGAIAGAVIGGVAELREFHKPERDASVRDASDQGADT